MTATADTATPQNTLEAGAPAVPISSHRTSVAESRLVISHVKRRKHATATSVVASGPLARFSISAISPRA